MNNNNTVNSIEVDLKIKTSENTKKKIKDFLDLFFQNITDEQFLLGVSEYAREYNLEKSTQNHFKYISELVKLN
jgi:hypothetical protein